MEDTAVQIEPQPVESKDEEGVALSVKHESGVQTEEAASQQVEDREV